jgi:hypothetical protein
MEIFIATDTAIVQLFFNIFTTGIETFVIPWDQILLRRVALVRTDVSEEPGSSFIRVTRICELGTTQAATSKRCTLRRNFFLMKEAPGSSVTSVLTRATRRNIPEDTILQVDIS